ncbi:hypothetical protein HAX54_003588 [Datura stramonium]|uniref:Uncharacterized protein n=1 Tax=Datura stramonium TaxID=4076 RepID=A0ABS8YB59_DATST|nr:hypothetical protein [Datura stramonium]
MNVIGVCRAVRWRSGGEGDFGRKRGKKREEGGGANGDYLVVGKREMGTATVGEGKLRVVVIFFGDGGRRGSDRVWFDGVRLRRFNDFPARRGGGEEGAPV